MKRVELQILMPVDGLVLETTMSLCIFSSLIFLVWKKELIAAMDHYFA